MTEKNYSVCLWDSCPELEEDTCNTGDDFATLEEAFKAYNDPKGHFARVLPWQWVEIDGPDVNDCRPIDESFNHAAADGDEDDWRREQAMQAGMGLGIEAYNDMMGY